MPNQQIRLQADEFVRKLLHAFDIPFSPANVDPDVLAVRPAKLLERLHQRRQSGLVLRVAFVASHQDADPSHGTGLLRPRHRRQRSGRASEHTENFPPPHVPPSPTKA